MAVADYKAAAVLAARKYGVPENMFLFQIGQESSWDANAKNPIPGNTSGGLGGFIDSTAKIFGIDKYDPYQALDAAAKYDAQLYAKHGSWEKALTAYGTLHDASDKVMNNFNQALAMDNKETGIIDKITSGAKSVWNNSVGGLATDTYNNLTGGEVSGAWDFKKWAGMGTFIVLGIVVIALAILSVPAVNKAATTAVTKGVK